jgi:hypothetical protein
LEVLEREVDLAVVVVGWWKGGSWMGRGKVDDGVGKVDDGVDDRGMQGLPYLIHVKYSLSSRKISSQLYLPYFFKYDEI